MDQIASRCEGCPYSGPAVGPRGNPDADFVIVGEAPGADELRTGKPFTGPSGELLESTLHKAGLPEGSSYYVTNALRCRPPAGAPPSKEAIDSCHNRLVAEVGSHPRRAVLALGNTAARSLLGRHDFKITQERGLLRQTELGPVIPTFHPAAVLRNNGEYPKMAADFTYAVSILGGEASKSAGETKWRVVGDEEGLEYLIQGLKTLDIVAADVETSGYNPRKNRVLALGIATRKNRVAIITEDMVRVIASRSDYRRVFEGGGPRFIWHNGKFDASFLFQMGINARVDEDTMLLHYALNEQRGTHDLKQLAADYLGVEDYKKELLKYLKNMKESFAKLPKPVLHKYLAKDCDNTWQLFRLFRPQVSDNQHLERLYTRLLMPASGLLQQVERRGVPVSLDAISELRTVLEEQRDAAETRMLAAAAPYWDAKQYALQTGAKKIPEQLNFNSPKQLLWLMNDRMELYDKASKPIPYSTREESLNALPQTEFVKGLKAHREVDKQLSTYVEGIADAYEDGWVHPTALIHGTVTGRLSMRNPPLQTIPRDATAPIKQIFRAPEGMTFLEFDYAGAELRVLAMLSGDEALKQIFEQNLDLHDEVSRAMYGENFTSEQRMRAKAVNFGIAYGRGPHSLAKEFGIPLDEAVEIVKAWFRRFPQAAAFISRMRRMPIEGRTIISPFGRHRRFGLVSDSGLNELQNEAVNFPMQSTASDFTLYSAIKVQPIIMQYGSMIVNLVHDSVLVLCPANESVIDTVVDLVVRQMVQTPIATCRSEVPFKVDVKVGASWGGMTKYQVGVKAA